MKETKEKEVDLTQLSAKEELSKIAEICKKLNYIFKKNNPENDKKSEEPSLKK